MRTIALAILIACVAGAPGEAVASKPATVRIAIEGMKFSPADVTVKPGDTVIWTNKDIVAHTVTSKSGAFDSKVMAPGATFKFVARQKGAFAYICSLHPMTAELKVR